MESIFVGIDVSKDRLDVAVRPSGETFFVERNARGLEALVARLRELSPHIIALEATGGFETIAAAALAGAGLPIVIVNPAQIRAFAKAIGRTVTVEGVRAKDGTFYGYMQKIKLPDGTSLELVNSADPK